MFCGSAGLRAEDASQAAASKYFSTFGFYCYFCVGKSNLMARKKANYPLIEGLEITTLAAEGKAMGRWNEQVVFVPMTA